MNPWLFDLLTVLWVATAGVVAWTRDKVKLTDDDLEIGEKINE